MSTVFEKIIFSFIIIPFLTNCSKNSINYDEVRFVESINQKRRGVESTAQLNCVKLSEEEIQVAFPNGKPNDQTFFKLVSKGFCPEKQYSLYDVIDKEITYNNEVVVDSQGRLIVLSSEKFLDQIPIPTLYFMNGEEIGFVLVPKDDSEYIAAILTPNPIEVTLNNSAKVSIVSFSHSMDLFVATGLGFVPEEEVDVISYDKDKVFTNHLKANENGTWYTILIHPGAGMAKLKVTRVNTGEECILEYAYGKQADNRRKLNSD